MKIKWLKLKRICEKLVNDNVDLIAGTELSKKIKGVSVKSSNRYLIILNLSYAKSLHEILEILAHEVTHILLNKEDHDKEFFELFKNVRAKIKEEYSKTQN